MTMPVKSTNVKVGILKMGWLVVEDVLMEPATVIVYYGRQRPLKRVRKISKGCRGGPQERSTSMQYNYTQLRNCN